MNIQKYLRVIGIDKKVSVIIPAYNCADYIKQCVCSVIDQTYKNTEIIVVNDGSTDNTEQILEKIDGIKLICKENGGVSSARNTGLDNACGDFVMFLDGDDTIAADVIERLVTASCEKHSDITRFRMRYFSDSMKESLGMENADYNNGFFVEKKDFKKNIYKKILSGIAFNSVCRNLYSRETIKKIRFSEKMRTGEDLLFNIDALTNAASFLYLADVFYNYRRTSGGLTGHGLSVADKYRYNAMLSREIAAHLQKWEMNTPYYYFLTYFRLAAITFDKVKRVLQNK